MAKALTTSSTVTCGHTGNVQTQSTAKLTVNGSSVLLRASIEGMSLPVPPAPGACATPDTPHSQHCSTVVMIDPPVLPPLPLSLTTKLTVGGLAVALDTLKGTTDGKVADVTPQLLLSATANQSKLTAV